MIAAGEPAPDFTLPDQDGEDVSLADFKGRKVLLVFYPIDFSPVCSDQLSIYQEVKPEIAERGVEMLGISVDHPYAHKAFQEKLGIDTPLLADFEPKGEVARAYGSYLDGARLRQPHPRPDRRGGHRRLGLRIAFTRGVPRRQRHLRRARVLVHPARPRLLSLSGRERADQHSRPAPRARRPRSRRGRDGDRLCRPRLPALCGSMGGDLSSSRRDRLSPFPGRQQAPAFASAPRSCRGGGAAGELLRDGRFALRRPLRMSTTPISGNGWSASGSTLSALRPIAALSRWRRGCDATSSRGSAPASPVRRRFSATATPRTPSAAAASA